MVGKGLFDSTMTIARKLKAWGVKGALGYLHRKIAKVALRRRFLADARNHPMREILGFTLIADFSGRGSLMKTMRDVVVAMKRAGVPYQTYNLGRTNELCDDAELFTSRKDFRILRYTHSIEMLDSVLPEELPLVKYVCTFWEFETGMLEAYPHLLKAQKVLAMSDFNESYFRRIMPDKIGVCKLLYPFRFFDGPLDDVTAVRSRYGIAQDDFTVFYNFGIGSARKNPKGCVAAFSRAFADTPKVKLLLKVMYAEDYPEELESLCAFVDELGERERVVMVTQYVSDAEIMNMTNACDVYLSLHRGEGFGLGMAEAMAFGKPVLATDWSASTEFVTSDCAIPVPYKMVPAKLSRFDDAVYSGVKLWADPDIEYAALKLRMLHDDPKERKSIGQKGREFIKTYFSSQNFRNSAMELLSV